jgi:prepilin peptidase CpaA
LAALGRSSPYVLASAHRPAVTDALRVTWHMAQAQPWLLNGMAAVALVIATYTDLRDGKIYNKLTFPCIIIGFLLNTLFSGFAGSWQSILGVGSSLLISLALAFCLGPALGGGDVKLLAVLGALRGPEFVFWTALYTALAGGLLVLIPLLRQRILGYTVRNLAWNLYRKCILRETVEIADGSRGGKQPFSVAILVGALLAFWKLGVMTGGA